MFKDDLSVVDGGIVAPPGESSGGRDVDSSTSIDTSQDESHAAPAQVRAAVNLLPLGTVKRGARHARTSWRRRYVVQLVAIDFIATTAAVIAAFFVRFVLPGDQAGRGSHTPLYAIFGTLLPLVWVCVVALNRGYQRLIVGAGPTEFQRIFRAFFQITALIAFIAYATHSHVARGFILTSLALALLLDLAGRCVARTLLHYRRGRGRSMTSVIAVGGAESIAHFAGLLRRDPYAGMRVTGACVPAEFVTDPGSLKGLAAVGIPLLGDVDSVRESVRISGAHTVAVLSGEISADKLRWISWQLEGTDTHLVVSPGLTEVAGSRLHVRPVAGLPMLHVEEPEFSGFRKVLKGAFDRAVAALAIVVLSPLLVGLAVAVRLGSPGSALFRQVRIGRDGSSFTMIKFRSLQADGETFTRLGKVLHRHSLDELPQLFNVLKGEMSLVGPRPPLPSEVAGYDADVRRRLLVKPGITGIGQVSARNELGWDETVRLDLRYVENWSFALDLMILWKTFAAVTTASADS